MSGSLFSRKGASIVLVSQFETGNKKSSKQKNELQKFVDYMSRESALRDKENDSLMSIDELEELNRIEKAMQTLSKESEQPIIKDVGTIDRYIDYMTRKYALEESIHNKEIVPGAFSSKNRIVTKEDIKDIKKEVIDAKNNQAVMFQDVISFDNNFLEEEGYYKKETDELNENVLYEATKTMMEKLKEKEKLVNPFWFATIHRNTEHIHIHVSTMERQNTREMKEFNGKLEAKGLRKQSTLNEMVFSFGNKMIDRTNQFERISELRKEVPFEIKDKVKQSLINMYLESSFEKKDKQEKNLAKMLQELKKEIPATTRGYNSLPESTRDKIDKFTNTITQNNPKKKEYDNLTKEIDVLYQKTYGKRYESDKYYKNRQKDFNERTGNAVVMQVKKLKQNETHGLNKKDLEKILNGQKLSFNYPIDKNKNNNQDTYLKRNYLIEKNQNHYKMKKDFNTIKKSINDDLNMYRAKKDFERVSKEIEYENKIRSQEIER